MYMKVQQLSLVVAFKDLSHFRRQILAHNAIRLLKNSADAHGLSKEEIATIKLYVSCSFLYIPLNEALRSEQYEQIKPWFSYLKLFHNAIYKLPERAGVHCRLVSGNNNIDLYQVDSFVTWIIRYSIINNELGRMYFANETSIEEQHGTIFWITSTSARDLSI
ncbi:unnamed protein product [Rotaria sordida]|uniref:Uncharacterized protein n=1 Tax=Rotaria sordida TaxID=392033 RepID=A0A819LWJ0_9BILA|nr:unnamed protein product [Rotaria sordida]